MPTVYLKFTERQERSWHRASDPRTPTIVHVQVEAVCAADAERLADDVQELMQVEALFVWPPKRERRD